MKIIYETGFLINVKNLFSVPLREIFMSGKEKELNKKLFLIED